jgi:2-polyprenyl-6-hydroxyphenyl methylase/3-demethylubiquinone-9 3-methyltransferase
MKAQNAIEWHTEIALNFDEKYKIRRNFIERFNVWKCYIDRYSNPGKTVFDIGCGSGIFSFYLAKKNRTVIGIDGSLEMLKICQTKKSDLSQNNISFLNCPIDSLQHILTNKADLIICSSVLEYLDNLDSYFKLLSSLLNKGGVLIFSLPNKSSIYRRVEPFIFKITGRPKYYQYVKNVCTLENTISMIRKYNFQFLASSYYANSLLSPVFRKLHLSKFSDNLFVVAAELK